MAKLRFVHEIKAGMVIAEFNTKTGEFDNGRAILKNGQAYELTFPEHEEAIFLAVLYGEEAYIDHTTTTEEEFGV